MKKSAIFLFIIFSSLILVNLPVYALEDLPSYNYSNTPQNTHTCTNLPDGRQDCLDIRYQCDQSSFNMTTRSMSCVHYATISDRNICQNLPDGRQECITIPQGSPVPALRTSLETRPMNMSNSTVLGTPTPVFQNTMLKNNFTTSNNVMINRDHFSPDSIQVTPGSTITWTNNDTITHRIRSGMPQGDYLIYDGIIDSGPLAPGQSFQIVENGIGIIRFYVTLHSPPPNVVQNAELQDSMNGTVTISKTPILNSTSATTNLLHNSTALNQTFSSGPTWVKKVFGWYDEGKLTEDELFSFVKYMIDNKILWK